jgi:outer membrane protein OmpA-like peptidoglycan-associated protein
MNWKTCVLAAVLALSVPAWAQSSSASDEPVSNATVDDFVNALTPKPRTRSLGRNIKVEPSRIDMTVNFDFDSARLQPESKPMLERLATALRTDQLLNLRFHIEGHTDAKGTVRYNDALSQRRAQAVVEFLSQNGVQTARLIPVGKGFSELLDANDPTAARNRRVRVALAE